MYVTLNWNEHERTKWKSTLCIFSTENRSVFGRLATAIKTIFIVTTASIAELKIRFSDKKKEEEEDDKSTGTE